MARELLSRTKGTVVTVLEWYCANCGWARYTRTNANAGAQAAIRAIFDRHRCEEYPYMGSDAAD